MNTIEALKLAREALLERAEKHMGIDPEYDEYAAGIRYAVDAIDKALAAPVAAEPEIVAQNQTIYCLNKSGTNRWWACVQPGQDDAGKRITDAECESVAAMLAAAPAHQSVREPLTWKQFVRAFAAEYPEDEDIAELLNAPEPERAEALRVVRMIERFHGITKE